MRLIVVFLAFLLGGCLTNVLNNPPARFDQRAPEEIQIEIKSDSFSPTAQHLGPEITLRHQTSLFDYTDYAYRMRGIVDKKTGLLLHQLYIEFSYPADWRFYNSAYLYGGESLEVRSISSNVGGCGQYACTLEETIGITIPGEEIERLASNNESLNVKVASRSGHEDIIRVPAPYLVSYFRSFSPAIQAYRVP